MLILTTNCKRPEGKFASFAILEHIHPIEHIDHAQLRKLEGTLMDAKLKEVMTKEEKGAFDMHLIDDLFADEMDLKDAKNVANALNDTLSDFWSNYSFEHLQYIF